MMTIFLEPTIPPMRLFRAFFRTNTECSNTWLVPCVLVYAAMIVGCVPKVSPTSAGDTSASNLKNTRLRVSETVERILERPLSVETHAAWQILHGVLAYGDRFSLVASGRKQGAVNYLVRGGEISGWDFSRGDKLPSGRIGLRSKISTGSYAGQGHTDQWLAVLSQSDLSLDEELLVDGKIFLVQDLLDQAMLDVSNNAYDEWSWSLIGITSYMPTSTKWTAADGEEWSVSRIVELEMNQDLFGSACGGTHRLIGMTMALNKRRQESASITGVWQETETYLSDAVRIAKQFQNPDGSFSNNYFSRTGVSADTSKVLASTGHTLEFLALTVSPEELREPWVLLAANRLCSLLDDSDDYPLECGALYHAVHGLQVFLERTAE